MPPPHLAPPHPQYILLKSVHFISHSAYSRSPPPGSPPVLYNPHRVRQPRHPIYHATAALATPRGARGGDCRRTRWRRRLIARGDCRRTRRRRRLIARVRRQMHAPAGPLKTVIPRLYQGSTVNQAQRGGSRGVNQRIY